MKPMESRWRNRQTREFYIDLLDSVDDPLGFAQGWSDVGCASARLLLAERLEKDAMHWARMCFDEPERSLIRAGLRAVDYHQVADRILERAQPVPVGKPKEDDDGDRCQ
jgi:hypothetical protein